MSIRNRVLPQPILSLTILGLWLVLAGGVSAGAVLLGGLLGIALPLVTSRFWPDRPRLMRPLAALRLVGVVLADIVVASVLVARQVLGPIDRLAPGFVEVPLDLRDPFVATILGSIISLTPGTVTTDIDVDDGRLRVHALDAPDPDALVASIKARYERPLKEIFAC